MAQSGRNGQDTNGRQNRSPNLIQLISDIEARRNANPPTGPAPTRADDCPTCGGIGFVRRAVPFGHEDFGKAFPCTCKADEIAAMRTAKLWSSAGVPTKYADYTLAGYKALVGDDPGKAQAIQAIRDYHSFGHVPAPDYPRRGILLYGDPGVGKTGALSPLFATLVKAGNEGLWLQYNDFLDDMRDFDSGNVRERMQQCKEIAYLFVDDFGDPEAARAATDYARDVMFRIIDYRVNNNLPMLITTNLTPAAISKQFHGRVARRISEVCALIEVRGSLLSPAPAGRG